MREIIGVIGGGGVAATNKLLELMEIKMTKSGAFRDAHHPEMIVYQATQAPSRSMYLEGRGPSFIDDYIDICRKLENAGVTKIAICCNTAHFAIDEIMAEAVVEVVNLIQAVILESKKSGVKNIGLIASDGCLMGKVYEKCFSGDYPEANIIYPSSDMQKMVTKGICNIKNGARFLDDNNPERPKNIFKQIVSHLTEKGAEKIIIGCVDIRVDYFDKVNLDSVEILADCLLEKN